MSAPQLSGAHARTIPASASGEGRGSGAQRLCRQPGSSGLLAASPGPRGSWPHAIATRRAGLAFLRHHFQGQLARSYEWSFAWLFLLNCKQ